MPDYTSGKLKKQVNGKCPFGNNKNCRRDCELFATEAPDDIHRSELKDEGIEYVGMCSIRLLAQATASLSRKQSSLGDL